MECEYPQPFEHGFSLPGNSYLATHSAAGREVHVYIRDTYVLDEYDRLRPLNYPGTDVFVLCIPAVSRHKQIFQDSVDMFWRDEIVRYGFQEVPLILLKTKVDEISCDNMEHQVWQEDVDLNEFQMDSTFCMAVSVHDKGLVTELVKKIVMAGLTHHELKARREKRKTLCALL